MMFYRAMYLPLNQMNGKTFNLFLLLFSFINLTVLPPSLLAQTVESQPNNQKPVKFKQPKPPPDAPKVGRGQGGASRGVCRGDNFASTTIIPLLPTSGWGLTASESLNLWVYVAYSGDRQIEVPLTAELSLENRQTDIKLEPKSYSIELPKTSGVFKISLPHVLAPEQWYRWYLAIECPTVNSARDDILQIEGFLRRQALNDSTHNSEFLSPPERVNFYTEQHIWYDAFHQATLLHCQNQGEARLKNYWKTLLQSEAVQLEWIGNRPVLCPN